MGTNTKEVFERGDWVKLASSVRSDNAKVDELIELTEFLPEEILGELKVRGTLNADIHLEHLRKSGGVLIEACYFVRSRRS